VRLEDERVSANGYRPEPVPADHSGNLAPLPHAVDQDARFGGERLQPLGEIAALNGDKTRVLVFEGVVHPACLYLGGSRAAAHQAFIDAATAYLAQWDVPFWATTFPLRIPDEMWVDCIHLFADGAAIFSRWLGAQVGAAAGQHRWEKPLLPDIIPPTSETVYQPLSAESAAAFDQFKAGFEGFPTDAIFWNPSSELEDPIGDFFRLVESVNAAPDEAVFELMIALNNLRYTDDLPLTTTQLAAPNAWRGDKQARHLREAGFDYLLFSDRWAQYLSGEEQETLRTQYQAVGRWSHPALDTTYILLKVGGE
jgi:hypothetical protein